VYEQALHIGLGVDLDLIPALHDPKDLYQLIRPNTAIRTAPTSQRGQALINGKPLKKEARVLPELV
jgi:hypothetical protein